MQTDIHSEIMEAVLGIPNSFSVNGRRFHLYPVTLGKSLMLSALMQSVEIDNDLLGRNTSLEVLRAVSAHRDIACRIIAISTLENRSVAPFGDVIDRRQKFFAGNLSDAEIAELLLLVHGYDKTPAFIRSLGLDKEQKELAKISKVKNKNGNTVSFGGKSVYGALINVACERYGWAKEYVVWGIDLMSLRMMLADNVVSVYLSDEDKKAARLTAGHEVISMDNPDNWAKIKAMKWD